MLTSESDRLDVALNAGVMATIVLWCFDLDKQVFQWIASVIGFENLQAVIGWRQVISLGVFMIISFYGVLLFSIGTWVRTGK
jgi:hypothetical protein